MNRTTAYATTAALGLPDALPEQPAAPAREACAARPRPSSATCGSARAAARTACTFGAARPRRGHRPARQRQVHADAPRGARHAASTPRTPATAGTPGCPACLPYAVYRPLVRLAHYAGLRRALRSGAGRRRARLRYAGLGARAGWPARPAAAAAPCICCCSTSRPDAALEGQRERGRGVSRYAFLRHRQAASAGCCASVETGRPARRAAARRCCSTGTRRTSCAGSASRTDRRIRSRAGQGFAHYGLPLEGPRTAVHSRR